MIFKKLICKLTGRHKKSFAFSMCGFGNYTGYNIYTCHECGGQDRFPCNQPHCGCCGGHCPDLHNFYNDVIYYCSCDKCRIRRTLTPELWVSDKITFLSIYKHFSFFQKTILIEALKDEVYDEIRKDINKYSVLL